MAAIWQEYHYGSDSQMTEKAIFREQKINLPKNHIISEGLTFFRGAVESKVMDARNGNQIDCNLPPDKIEALKYLTKLQKDKQIIVEACDKGAGKIILTYKDYMKACYEHLTAEMAPSNPYFSPVNELGMEETKTKIKNILQEALENNIITKNKFTALLKTRELVDCIATSKYINHPKP